MSQTSIDSGYAFDMLLPGNISNLIRVGQSLRIDGSVSSFYEFRPSFRAIFISNGRRYPIFGLIRH